MHVQILFENLFCTEAKAEGPSVATALRIWRQQWTANSWTRAAKTQTEQVRELGSYLTTRQTNSSSVTWRTRLSYWQVKAFHEFNGINMQMSILTSYCTCSHPDESSQSQWQSVKPSHDDGARDCCSTVGGSLPDSTQQSYMTCVRIQAWTISSLIRIFLLTRKGNDAVLVPELLNLRSCAVSTSIDLEGFLLPGKDANSSLKNTCRSIRLIRDIRF